MEFRICAAIVTYGNRFHLLKQVLDYCIQSAIHEILIVDNGSSEASKKAILDYQSHCKKAIHLVDLGKNTGSALGFKTAIEQAAKQDSDYLLILDDDNLPRPDLLNRFQAKWEELKETKGLDNTILLANRIDRVNFKSVIRTGEAMAMLQRPNHFLGFHWGDIGHKISERIFKPKPAKESSEQEVFEVAAAPYSGMFFHRSLIQKHGLPNADYVLYMDDFEYSHRLYLNGVGIYLLPHAVIDDLESSVYLPKKKGIFYHSLFEGHEVPMFYAFRNMLVFSNQYLKNKAIIYRINRLSFWAMMIVLALLNGKISKLKLLRDATYAGENNILGENSTYPLA